MERSGSKGKGAEEFHWFESFFLSLSLTKTTSLDRFKQQQTQVSMNLEKLHKVRRVLHTNAKREDFLFLRCEKFMKSKEAGGRGNGGNHIPKYLGSKFLGSHFLKAVEIALPKGKKIQSFLGCKYSVFLEQQGENIVLQH